MMDLMIFRIAKLIAKKVQDNDVFLLIKALTYFIFTQRFVTTILGPIYERSRDLIEIDLTYACKLGCFNCDRSCGLAPSDDRLTPDQIHKFIHESISRGLKWKRIRLLGGEPTLHPDFLEILAELHTFKRSHCPEATIEVWTSGFGKKVNDVLTRIGKGVIVCNTEKTSPKQCFQPFNLAPKDFAIHRYTDFSCGCPITARCGIGLSPYGYYPCAVAASIDRVFGFDVGRKSLPELDDSMQDQLELLCAYCGHFRTTRRRIIGKHLMSESWQKAYGSYKLSKPRLSLY